MPQTRQLAVIMFTEIVGYTGLLGKDEQNAFNLLRKKRKISYWTFGRKNYELQNEKHKRTTFGFLLCWPTNISSSLYRYQLWFWLNE
jgi:hypothetical protein